MQTETNDLKCAHAPCNCSVAEGKKYCSDQCRKADMESGQASTSAAQCPCGHAGCRQG